MPKPQKVDVMFRDGFEPLPLLERDQMVLWIGQLGQPPSSLDISVW